MEITVSNKKHWNEKKTIIITPNPVFQRNAGRGLKNCGAIFEPTPGSLASLGVR